MSLITLIINTKTSKVRYFMPWLISDISFTGHRVSHKSTDCKKNPKRNVQNKVVRIKIE